MEVTPLKMPVRSDVCSRIKSMSSASSVAS
jgi:hypothetical protein